jgi:hypothetical protein
MEINTTIDTIVNGSGATVLSFPAPNEKSSDRPEIQLVAGEQPRVTDEVFKVIKKEGSLYKRGGMLVCLDDARTVEASEEFLADYLGRRIDFFKMKPVVSGGFERVEVDPPSWLCKRIGKLPGKRGVPELVDIITAPILRPDGSVLNAPGYDDETKLLLLPGKYPSIQDHPSYADIREAWNALWLPFSKFPYVSDDDRAVAAAAILTAMIRRVLPLAPGFNFDAPVPSSGKTLLGKCIQELVGWHGNATPYTDDKEARKTLTAFSLDGKPSILFDNVKGTVRSPSLEAYLTTGRWSDRVLCTSKSVDVPTNILILFSGNNFQPGGDLWRRVLTCRVDPRVEDAHRRKFDMDPQAYCRENRQRLVAAALTFLRGFVSFGKPQIDKEPLGTFEAWDSIVRQCVLWLGQKKIAPVTDPIASMGKARANDPDRQRLSVFLQVVYKATEGKPFRVAELVEKANSAFKEYDALRNVVLEVGTAGSSQFINNRVLGKWIAKREDTRCNGRWIERGKFDSDGNQLWVVKEEKQETGLQQE